MCTPKQSTCLVCGVSFRSIKLRKLHYFHKHLRKDVTKLHSYKSTSSSESEVKEVPLKKVPAKRDKKPLSIIKKPSVIPLKNDRDIKFSRGIITNSSVVQEGVSYASIMKNRSLSYAGLNYYIELLEELLQPSRMLSTDVTERSENQQIFVSYFLKFLSYVDKNSPIAERIFEQYWISLGHTREEIKVKAFKDDTHTRVLVNEPFFVKKEEEKKELIYQDKVYENSWKWARIFFE